MRNRLEIKSQVVTSIKNKYSWLSNDEVGNAFDYALADYLFYRYPSTNNRPIVDEIDIDFAIEQWLRERMEDILSRAGGTSLTAYKENGLEFEYGASHIDPSLASKIIPKAGVPQ